VCIDSHQKGATFFVGSLGESFGQTAALSWLDAFCENGRCVSEINANGSIFDSHLELERLRLRREETLIAMLPAQSAHAPSV